MNKETVKKLKQCEEKFFSLYPQGFDSEQMRQIEKKHKPTKMIALAHEMFAKQNFSDPYRLVDDMSKFVGRSSMVSLFEKPKFRDFVNSLESDEKKCLSDGLFEMIHGDEESGFNTLVEQLVRHKMAKWSLISVFKVYYNPDTDVFVKPTTAKAVLNYFAINDLIYKPAPTYAFYSRYRDLINALKKEAAKELSVSNMAFTGFLMLTIDSA